MNIEFDTLELLKRTLEIYFQFNIYKFTIFNQKYSCTYVSNLINNKTSELYVGSVNSIDLTFSKYISIFCS